jgi:hypothetical protein
MCTIFISKINMMEFGALNQYERETYPSIGNFTWNKKKYAFGGQKGENKSLEPKNGTQAPKIKNKFPCLKVKNKYAFQKIHT